MEVELLDTGLKRDVRGRRIEGAGERERLLAAYDVSGLTQKAFAAREGIVYSTFVSWLKQRRQQHSGEAPASAAVFHEVVLSSGAVSPLEVCFADGLVLRGSDAHLLATLVKALRC